MKREYEFSKKIMGTDLYVSIICNDIQIAKKTFEKIFEELQKYEEKFSRFIDHSELSILNNKKNMIVSDDFIEVITEAKKMFKETNGFFNPLLQISEHGYDKSFELLEKENNTKNTIKKYDINFDSVIIDSQNNLIILNDNQKLDFGGLLKGFLSEKIAKKYFKSDENITGIIINIGGDLYTMGLDENDKVFKFSIYNPITNKDDFLVPLFNCSLATSGTYKRTWKNNGKEVNHILDETGEKNPHTEIVSASVISNSGAKSDSYTKYLISNSIEKIKDLENKEMKYVLINKKGEFINNLN